MVWKRVGDFKAETVLSQVSRVPFADLCMGPGVSCSGEWLAYELRG